MSELIADPHWYRTAVIYQLHVRSFADGNGDGIGDFVGLTKKLDHIQRLGATAVWLLPFYPSPLRDGGYDIARYTDVNTDYGDLKDFRKFIKEAHDRGLRVITEVVINHTSDQHPWFQKSRRAKPGTKWRDYYVWSDTDKQYSDARIIFSDFETSNWTWDSEAGAYFWHRFYSHQPDLNFDNPHVHDAVMRVVDFWLDVGVDGLRLDAVPYLYEREGTTCENLPETHAFLRKLRAHVDAKYADRMLLAEANQWPEDTQAYFGQGDECHMAFNFPVMPRMYMAVQMEDRYPLVDILEQTPDIPEGSQWALFLRNHDELTLEMVTDEERDYMYRVFATDPQARINLGIRRRLAPLLNNDRRKMELLNGLLLSMPGTPIIYYGDEVGMGDNIYLGDRDGVRTPMQWNADRNAGFSSANPQQLFLPVNIDPEYRYESVNVASQEGNPHSLLLWMRRLISIRQRHAEVFGTGELEFLRPDNAKVLCYLRKGAETILIVANLSRFSQYVELDLAEYKNSVPVEVFGQSQFPPIGELPYLLTLGPYAFYWFVLQPSEQSADDDHGTLPSITTSASWGSLFDNARSRGVLEAALPQVLATRRWFAGKGRKIASTEVVDSVAIPLGTVREFGRIMFVAVHYTEGEPDTYVVPVCYLPEQYADEFLTDHPGAGLLRVQSRGSGGMATGVLCEAMAEELFTNRLLHTIAKKKRIKARSGELAGLATRVGIEATGSDLWPSLSKSEQSNTSVFFGDRYVLKLFRRSEVGPNPDWEIGRFLTEKANFPHTPKMLGSLRYTDHQRKERTLAVLQEYVANEGDAWQMTLHQLSGFFERLAGLGRHDRHDLRAPSALAGLSKPAVPDLAHELFGPMLQNASLLGERTAQMHLALASRPDIPDFAPEPFNPHYQRSVYQTIRNQVTIALSLLRKNLRQLDEADRQAGEVLLDRQPELLAALDEIKTSKLLGPRMRIHGDFHLGQVLFTGKDFVIMDFEGEPNRALSVRRFKRSPLRDVAGLLRSWDYAAHAGAAEYIDRFNLKRTKDLALVDHGAQYWSGWVSAQYLESYLAEAADLYQEESDRYSILLRAFLVEKAAYELSYELGSRPTWVSLPIHGLLRLLG